MKVENVTLKKQLLVKHESEKVLSVLLVLLFALIESLFLFFTLILAGSIAVIYGGVLAICQVFSHKSIQYQQ